MRIIKTTTLEKIAGKIKEVQFPGIYKGITKPQPPIKIKFVNPWGIVKTITLKN